MSLTSQIKSGFFGRSLDASKVYWSILIIVLAIFFLSIWFNIYPLRQILGFIFFIILPGWLFLRLARIGKLEFWEAIILSVGFSVAYLMFMGAIINGLYFYFGYKTPLSANSLLPTFTVSIILLGVVVWRRNPLTNIPDIFEIKKLLHEPFVLAAILLPILAALGAEIMNRFGNNFILVCVYIGIMAYIAIISLARPKSSYLYATAIWAIGLSLLFMYSLRSEHILGYDVFGELTFFQRTLTDSYWNINAIRSSLNACLSVVILPPVIKLLLDLNAEYVYKIVYALIFSITPIAIFFLSKKYMANLYAFLVSIFFVIQTPFFATTQSNPRTAIAIMFFALFLFILFDEHYPKVFRATSAIIFMVALVVSHYSTAYIFFAILTVSFIASYLGKGINKSKTNEISLIFLALTIAFIFVWYAQVSTTNFENGVLAVKSIFTNLGDFFLVESRQEGTLRVMGIGVKSLGDSLYSFSHYLVSVIIAIGILALVYSAINGSKLSIILHDPEKEFLAMMVAAAFILASIVFLPYLSREYTSDRLWTEAMVLLSFPFVVGFFAAGKERHIWLRLLLLAILLFHFANTNYLFYQATGEQHSLVLNSAGINFAHFFVHDSEIASSKWLAKKIKSESLVYSDFDGGQRLYFGPVASSWKGKTFFLYQPAFSKDDYIYLDYNNVILGTVFTGRESLPIKDFNNVLIIRQKIFDNGGSQIYG
jgi:uncharacterized membrane protein